MRILLAEDEVSIANFIQEGLEEEGFAVDMAHNGKEGLRMALDNLEEYDILLLDWMLPGLSGIEICRQVRRVNLKIPIIFLTAKDSVEDVVFGLEAGANDYIRKPFAFDELLARIRLFVAFPLTLLVLFLAVSLAASKSIAPVLELIRSTATTAAI